MTAVEVSGRALRGARRAGTGSRSACADVRTLRVRIAACASPTGATAGAGGIRELRIPGVQRARGAAAAGARRARARRPRPPRTGLTYLFQRTTGDDPFRRDAASAARRAPRSCATALDGERGLERASSPAGRAPWTVDGWASAAADAPDAALDRLAGVRGGASTSSGRFEGRPGLPRLERVRRHAAAVDRLVARRPHGVARVDAPRPATIRDAARSTPVAGRAAADARAARAATAATPPLASAPTATVRAARSRCAGAASGSRSCAPRSPPGTPGVERQRRAVGIAEIRGAGVPRVDVAARGRADAALRRSTGTVGGRRAAAARRRRRSRTSTPGRPLRVARLRAASRCPPGAARLELPAGRARAVPAAPALAGRRRAAPGAARAASSTPARRRRGGRTGVRLDARRARLARARRELQPRPARELRRPRPRRAGGRRRVRHGLARARRLPRGRDRVRARTGWCTRATSSRSVARADPARCSLVAAAARAARGATPAEPSRRPADRRAAHAGAARGADRRAGRRSRSASCSPPAAAPLFALGVVPRPLARDRRASRSRWPAARCSASRCRCSRSSIRPENRGGYNPEYAIDRIAVHWVAVAGVALLLALARAQ